MNPVFFIFLFLFGYNSFCQDTIFRYEEKPIIGNIVYTDKNIILYQKGNYIEDIPSNFVYGYKMNLLPYCK